MLVAGADRGEFEATRHRSRICPIRRGAVAKLGGPVQSPAVGGSCSRNAADVVAGAAADRDERQVSCDFHRHRAVDLCPVSELSPRVVTPAIGSTPSGDTTAHAVDDSSTSSAASRKETTGADGPKG